MLHVELMAISTVANSLSCVIGAIDLAGPIKTELAKPLADAGQVLIPAGAMTFVIHHMFRHGGDGLRTIVAEGTLAGGGALALLAVVRHLGGF
jgi:hypothetical protein